MENKITNTILSKLHQFCIENKIANFVCILESEDHQTIVAKVFPFGPGYPFYVSMYDKIEQSVQKELADWHCKNCKHGFSADEVLIIADGLQFFYRCPHCNSEKIEII